jgi:hypothetical protein
MERNGEAYKIGCEVITGIIQAIIHERGNDTFSSVSHLPYWSCIHHVLRELVIDKVPLFFKEGILNAEARCNCTGGFRKPRSYWRRGTLNSLA